MSKVLKVNDFAAFFAGGSANLAANKDRINTLNVFPVPDGDTGTNMSLTMSSAVKNLDAQDTIMKAAQVLAHGALLGARGNSGVILSQILRGFAQGLEGVEEISAADFAAAMKKGVELAYKSVMRPVEGTILTVARKMGEAAEKAVAVEADMTVEALLELMLAGGHKALANTPNQLPALKQAGVVDSGASGLIAVFEGGLRALRGEEFAVPAAAADKVDFTAGLTDDGDRADFVNHYCTEFFIHGENIDIEAYRAHLQNMGESQVIVGNETVVKTHIHTADPGAVLSYALQLGSLHDLKIDNMKDQHRETLFDEDEQAAARQTDLENALQGAAEAIETAMDGLAPAELTPCGVVVVSSGEGLDQIFTEMGAARLVNGGQSMNPSAADILAAVNNTPAAEVLILPNNSNVIMAANQARDLAKKPVIVIPTKFITQGISAMMNFDPDLSAAENAKAMNEAAAVVKNAQITYAVRDSSADGQKIRKGDILGILDGKITVVKHTVNDAVMEILPQMFDDETSLITLLYGEDIDGPQALKLVNRISAAYPDYEVEVQFGGQNVYHYLLAVE